MRAEVIEDFCGGKTEEYEYLCEVARRLEPIVGNHLTWEEAMSLIKTLSIRTFDCEDGFVISDYSLEKTIGDREAIAVVASLMTADLGDQDNLASIYYVVEQRIALAERGAYITERLLSAPGLQAR
jgi:hypothetical protein